MTTTTERKAAYYVVAADGPFRFRHYMKSDGTYQRSLDTAERFQDHAAAVAAARFSVVGCYVVPVNPWILPKDGA